MILNKERLTVATVVGGFSLLAASIGTGFWLLSQDASPAATATIAALGVISGAVMLLRDRLTILELNGIGRIQAAAARAEEEVARIEALVREMETMRVRLSSVAEESERSAIFIQRLSDNARGLSDRLDAIAPPSRYQPASDDILP